MRIVFVFVLLLLAGPAYAQGWEAYQNSRFGYSLEIPPDFVVQRESDNGDGATFAARGQATYLSVWGGNLLGDLETEVGQQIAAEADGAWNVGSQTVTPRWASWSAIKGSRMAFQRMVMLCDGSQYAAFRLDYSVVDGTAMDPIIERLAARLRGDC